MEWVLALLPRCLQVQVRLVLSLLVAPPEGTCLDRDHELSAVLADETRYQIYRCIAERPRQDVTVAEIAELFHLHPNVARMHLAKLEQCELVATSFRRTSGGGRPAKLYRLSDKVVTFGFPPRRYELLARLALGSLAAGGSRGDVLRVCGEAGAGEARRALAGNGKGAGGAIDVAELVRRITEEQGLFPEVLWEGEVLRVTLHNCAFGEAAGSDPDLVCPMHRAFLGGVLEVVTGGRGCLIVEPGSCRISSGDDRCELSCRLAADEGVPDAR